MSNWRDPKESDYQLPPGKKPKLSNSLNENGKEVSHSNKLPYSIIIILLLVSVLSIILYSRTVSRLRGELAKREAELNAVIETNNLLTQENQRQLKELAEIKSKPITPPPPSSSKDVVVAELLKKNPGWREAVFSDSKDPILQRYREQNPNYNPYYAEGDLNQDGLKDFVIVVIPESADKGSVFWFPGTTDGYEQEERVMRVKAIDRLSISISNAGELLIIDSDTKVTFRFTWDKDANKLVQSPQ